MSYQLHFKRFTQKKHITIYYTGIRKLSYGNFSFPSHKSFQVCQLDVSAQTLNVDSAYKLAEPFVTM